MACQPGLRGFALVLVPASLGGAAWEWLGLPLGWLIGAAVVTGAFAIGGMPVGVPAPLTALSLAVLGASVGLAITPEVARAMLVWVPLMLGAAAGGILLAALLSRALARAGGMSRATAFFALLPGGVVEMAKIGDRAGADPTVISALHAVRVGLVVALIPLGIVALTGAAPPEAAAAAAPLAAPGLGVAIAAGLAGGWLGARAGLPAAWLLGAVIAVGLLASLGLLPPGGIPALALAIVQVVVGIGLGARYRRDRLAGLPRALAAGTAALLALMASMAALAALAGLALPLGLATLILCFSIGGMAEMVLTSKAVGADFALVAAFQAVRGIVVNASAGLVWRRLAARGPTPPS